MEPRKSTRNQVLLKGFWWFVLIFSFFEVLISDSFIGLKEGFDWSLIDQPKFYLKLIYYLSVWAIGYYLLFLNPDRMKKVSKTQQLESNDK